jgi:hypothetical protein
MYDDGVNDDGVAGNYVWGVNLGTFGVLDVVSYSFEVIDETSIKATFVMTDLQFPAVHNVGNVLLTVGGDSQLGDQKTAYSGTWNGQDYLWLGGLWVGTDIQGAKRMICKDYYRSDWDRIPGNVGTSAPGISDQDIDFRYGDQLADLPIGLEVRQRSFQWAAEGWSDFIIISYEIKNTGVNGASEQIFTGLWCDPDVTLGASNLPGYDAQRKLLYFHNEPAPSAGYIGFKVMGATAAPFAAFTYRRGFGGDPDLPDSLRFELMSAGGVYLSDTTGDYRMLLTAEPYTLSVGESKTISYGMVFGNDLEDLQAHSDSMDVVFESHALTSVEEIADAETPERFLLEQNYPNPFNPATIISYSLPRKVNVDLKIFDIQGRQVAILVDGTQEVGNYKSNWNADGFPSGIYFYRLQAGDYVATRKMLLVK